ncbi:1,6-anhydro-N-acetylmuramyl-L-alanine amidase AmpD [Thiolapillus brandeum]|uniref:1,6-anhydro-N-acetylmuramyl-L-alanine amidase AmpD n=1 Tax=Thiolapillus brandeum TaxID=1076588 RepID=A0A7U6GHZ5_9GAMM|nr:1,6-anhydro-N-acetylmuramyl-L-alanine amidase AmpD [Thiolapillus brandeum]BAO43964.1 N-acetylmuramoyl-L-alanine amidase [Thiolapillus brandeum]
MPAPFNTMLSADQYLPSPNHDERPAGTTPDLLVIHNISLPPDEYGGPWIADLFLNQLDPCAHPYFAKIYHMKVSAHALVRRDGEVIQFVSLDKRAWHAGESCFDDRKNCNDYSIGIEMEGSDRIPYTNAQYQALARITREIMEYYPGITSRRITGHENIAPGRKTDPGPAFDWKRYRTALINP